MKAEQIVRTGEDVFQRKYSGKSLSNEQWLDALLNDPILIERAIVVNGDKTVVGRPPEKVLNLF
jgi:arsenate reductase